MTKQVEIKVENNVLNLHGDLDFNNVMTVYKQVLPYIIKASSDITINFSGLASANSSAVALAIDWMRYANRVGKKIRLLSLSPEIVSLVKAAGLEEVFA